MPLSISNCDDLEVIDKITRLVNSFKYRDTHKFSCSGYAQKKGSSRLTKEDLSNEAFLALKGQDYDENVCKNAIRRAIYKQKQQDSFGRGVGGENIELENTFSAESRPYEVIEQREAFDKLIENLNEKEKMFLTLRYFYGKTLEEAMGECVVKNGLDLEKKALRKLRKRNDGLQ